VEVDPAAFVTAGLKQRPDSRSDTATSRAFSSVCVIRPSRTVRSASIAQWRLVKKTPNQVLEVAKRVMPRAKIARYHGSSITKLSPATRREGQASSTGLVIDTSPPSATVLAGALTISAWRWMNSAAIIGAIALNRRRQTGARPD
jgi:hypothetical protein